LLLIVVDGLLHDYIFWRHRCSMNGCKWEYVCVIDNIMNNMVSMVRVIGFYLKKKMNLSNSGNQNIRPYSNISETCFMCLLNFCLWIYRQLRFVMNIVEVWGPQKSILSHSETVYLVLADALVVFRYHLTWLYEFRTCTPKPSN